MAVEAVEGVSKAPPVMVVKDENCMVVEAAGNRASDRSGSHLRTKCYI